MYDPNDLNSPNNPNNWHNPAHRASPFYRGAIFPIWHKYRKNDVERELAKQRKKLLFFVDFLNVLARTSHRTLKRLFLSNNIKNVNGAQLDELLHNELLKLSKKYQFDYYKAHNKFVKSAPSFADVEKQVKQHKKTDNNFNNTVKSLKIENVETKKKIGK